MERNITQIAVILSGINIKKTFKMAGGEDELFLLNVALEAKTWCRRAWAWGNSRCRAPSVSLLPASENSVMPPTERDNQFLYNRRLASLQFSTAWICALAVRSQLTFEAISLLFN